MVFFVLWQLLHSAQFSFTIFCLGRKQIFCNDRFPLRNKKKEKMGFSFTKTYSKGSTSIIVLVRSDEQNTLEVNEESAFFLSYILNLKCIPRSNITEVYIGRPHFKSIQRNDFISHLFCNCAEEYFLPYQLTQLDHGPPVMSNGFLRLNDSTVI